MRMMHWQPLSLSWQPSERIDSLRRQLDQVFDDFTVD
jgi:HSP20 family protein